jgi:protein O-mannosyl-transferase
MPELIRRGTIAQTSTPGPGERLTHTPLPIPALRNDVTGSQSLERIVFPGLILLLTLLAYTPALAAGYIWDDDFYVTANPTLRDLAGLRSIWLVPTSIPQYYPLVHTTFWIEYQLWELDPLGYHLVNVLLHVGASLLLARLLIAAGFSRGVAWFTAAVFALHPVHVESVAWITERKNTLSGLCYIAAFLAYVRFDHPLSNHDSTSTPKRPRRWGFYALSLILFIMALLSKTVTCSLPVAILLLYWFRRGRLTLREILPTIPLFFIGAALAMVTVWIEHFHVGAKGEDWILSPAQRVLIAGRALWFYAGKLVWPSNLSFIYPRWDVDASVPWQWLFPVAAVATLVILFRLRNHPHIGRGPFAAVAFFAMTLFPALGFINTYPMRYSFVADHFQYLASLGILLLVVSIVADGIARAGPTAARLRPFMAVWVLLAMMVVTFAQSMIYIDEDTLWKDTITKNPTGWLAWNNLGTSMLRQGQIEEAMHYFKRVTELEPTLMHGYLNVGSALLELGRPAEALPWIEKALPLLPDNVNTIFALARAQRGIGDLDKAVESYVRVLKLDAKQPEARRELAMIYLLRGQDRAAAKELRIAADQAPGNLDILAALAWVLATSSDPSVHDGSNAVLAAEHASKLTDSPRATLLDTLAAAYARAGRFDKAVATAEKAVESASGSNDFSLASSIRQRLSLYRNRTAFQQPPLVQPVTTATAPSTS